MSRIFVCDMQEASDDMTDEEIEARQTNWSEVVQPSPISRAEAERRLREDPFCKIPPVKGKEEGFTLDLARRWVEERGSVPMRALFKLMGPGEVFEKLFAGLEGSSLDFPTRDEVLKGARASIARDAAKVGYGTKKQIAAILNLTPARITQLAKEPPKEDQGEVDGFLEDATLLLERERQAFLARTREVLKTHKNNFPPRTPLHY